MTDFPGVDAINARVGHRLRLLRTAQRLTQRDLVDRLAQLGVKWNNSRIARAETGEATFDAGELSAVAAALGVPVDALLGPVSSAVEMLDRLER